ncbi:MAG: nucleoside-diphosphate kinase [Deltaproteobacteria bacterium]|nr:nucleoside-diphosphate kinase [Deltaproteobacteria bacterium]
MAIEQTLSIIKPDGVQNGHIGHVISIFEGAGLRIAAAKLVHLTAGQAGAFYAEHKERPFYGELVEYMTSGAVMLMVLEGEDAIAQNRKLMGATDPAQADEGTIRKLYAESKGKNTVHGSDSPASAAREVAFFFSAAFELV